MLTNPRTLPSSLMSHVVLLAHQPRSPSCVTQLLSRRPEDAPAPPADHRSTLCLCDSRTQGSLKQVTHTLHEATRRSRQLLQPLGPCAPCRYWSFSISRAFPNNSMRWAAFFTTYTPTTLCDDFLCVFSQLFAHRKSSLPPKMQTGQLLLLTPPSPTVMAETSLHFPLSKEKTIQNRSLKHAIDCLSQIHDVIPRSPRGRHVSLHEYASSNYFAQRLHKILVSIYRLI